MPDDFRTPVEIWREMQTLVLAAEQDAHKATRGMRAGGIRLRAHMQAMIQLSTEMRCSVMMHRKPRKPRRKAPLQPANSTPSEPTDLLAG